MSRERRRMIVGALGGALIGAMLAWFLIHTLTGKESLVLSYAPEGATVFVDEEVRAIVGKKGSARIRDLAPDTQHRIIVAKENFWPWTKTIILSEGEKRNLATLLLPIEAQAHDNSILNLLSEEERAGIMTEAKKLPSRREPLPSKDEHTALFVENQGVYLQWNDAEVRRPSYYCTPECDNEILILPARDDIRSIEFFKERSDVVLFAARDSIYALEADAHGTQNFQPLYTGRAPLFLSTKNLNRELLEKIGELPEGLVIFDEGELVLLEL